jgi:gamma-glutamylcyclotransferase (GGCT)/AIG2-like uncharacterized protein YtfP
VNYLFVYGTLRGMGGNYNLISEGTVKGQLWHLGSFPGLVLGGNFDVIGEIHQVTDQNLQNLDYYEGTPVLYRRVKVPVLRKEGDFLKCWVYEYAQPILPRHRLIVSGDWLNQFSEVNASNR